MDAILEASRRLGSAGSLSELSGRLAHEAESLAAADAALVVLKRGRELRIVAATDPVDRDDVALATQSGTWVSLLEDGGLPHLAAGPAAIREAFGDGPLADRYDAAIEVPLVVHGGVLGLIFALRRAGSASAFDPQGLQAIGLLADVASCVILMRRMNARMRRTNRRLVHSMKQLARAQSRLVQSEKLRAVGALVSGVAHELNNPLTSLSGFAQLLAMGGGLDSDQRSWAREIQREAERCSVILQNLLGFARHRGAAQAPAPAAAVVAETLALKSYDIRAACVTVRDEVPKTLPTPAIDRQELQQVLLNLVNNALHAMRDARERVLTVRGSLEGDHVVLEVCDTGCGIAEENLERIFEPFVSTKPAGDSIGLGLSTCRKILGACGGSVSARSRVGEGSAFRVVLPSVRALSPV
jgi:signal transduction histidine kinase